jgi:hypothetical protein
MRRQASVKKNLGEGDNSFARAIDVVTVCAPGVQYGPIVGGKAHGHVEQSGG